MSSRPFDARMTAGECFFCIRAVASDARIQRGEHVLYLTAFAVGSEPGRPLTLKELKIWRELGRERKAARKRKQPLPKGPEWLWDRMVHVSCAQENGFPIPGGQAAPRMGTRILGHADGTAVNKAAQAGFVGETAAQKRARAAMAAREAAAITARRERQAIRQRELAAERLQVEARRIREREARAAAMAAADKARAERQAAAENERKLVELADGDASVGRFLRLDLDDETATPADDGGYDASVERFKLLDLD